jgi:hypothetical protein
MRSFSGVADGVASAGRQADIQVSSIYSELGLWYMLSSSIALLGFLDADFAGVLLTDNRLRKLVSSSVPHWFLGLLANSQKCSSVYY